ncbi:MAG: TolC family protein [Planctomycetota bacterium]|jgi:cobalt-zinc-cadmium efflux system outer membrane protein
MRTSLPILFLLLSACALPHKPTPMEMDVVDRSFHGPSKRDRAEEILRKDELTLEDTLRLVDLLNPTLESLRKDVDLAPLEAWDASLFPNPELAIEVEEFPTGGGRSLGNSERGFGLSQSIPVGGRLGAASSVAALQRKVAALRYLRQRRVILTEAKSAFHDVLAAKHNVDLTRHTRDLAEQFHDLTEERFKAEAVPEMEVLKAAVNLAKAGTDVRMAETDLAVAIKTLHALIGDVNYPVEKFSGELFVRFEAPSLEALKGQVIVAHPELEIVRAQKTLAERELDLAGAGAIPDVNLDVAHKWTEGSERILEFGVSVPIPLFNRNQAKIVAATIRVRQAELRIQETKNAVTLALIETYRNFAAAQERVETYRKTILPKAQKALDQTNEGYKAGKFSYLDVLDSQQTLAEARIAYIFALKDLNRFASELEQLTGSRLQGIR